MQYAPDKPAFGGGLTATALHPAFLVATVLAVLLILTLPRKRIAAAFLLPIFLGSYGQQIYIGGVHLFVLRILIVVGLIRVFTARREPDQSRFVGGWNSVDTAFLLWVICRAGASTIQYHGALGEIIYQVGFIWEALGGYVLMRFLIRNEEDIVYVMKIFAAIVVVLGITMLNEKLRGQNVFGFLRFLPMMSDTREGSIRAQGASAHPILAGVLGVTLIPLFWWLWQSGKAKLAGILGSAGSTAMMVTCASSTPLLAYLAAFLGLCFWPMRKNMRSFRWGLVIALVALHLVMQAPVWFLIAHVDLVAGNSGYHRAMLIDQCIRHFGDWWLVGTDTSNWGWDMWDLSNQFVAEADTGGLLTFTFFILVISRSFSRIGRARRIVEGDSKQERFMWFLGVALFAHCVGFFGISYFDHTRIAWCAFLAMAIAATAPVLAQEAGAAGEQENGSLAKERPFVDSALMQQPARNRRIGGPGSRPIRKARTVF